MKIPLIPRATMKVISELEARGLKVISMWDGKEWRHSVSQPKEKNDGPRVQ